MTAKGAAQPNQPDETAPPSDGGAVSPGAAEQTPADKAKTDGTTAAAGKQAGASAKSAAGDGAAGADTKADPKANDVTGSDTTIDLDVTLSQRDGAAPKAGAKPGAKAATKSGGDSPRADAGASTVDGAAAPDDTGADAGASTATADRLTAADPAVDETAETEGQPLYAELETLRRDLGELTRDLQRVSAEYANYRKRVDRDRTLAADQATAVVLTQLLAVLDDLDRARDHGDLVGPFGAVAEQLVATLTKFGLTPFGEPGDPFDPTLHEAVSHTSSPDVSETTCVEIMRRGYLLGDRLLRAALVGVADPQ